MPFVQSLVCWLGADNRQRFSLIIAACHLFFIFSTLLFPTSIFVQAIALLLSLIAIICSTKRRLNDSRLTEQWLLIPGSVFLLTGVLIMAIDGATVYWLATFPLATAAILLTYPSQHSHKYTYGYAGPVDLTQQSTTRRQRIEPQLRTQLSNIDATTVFEQTERHNREFSSAKSFTHKSNSTDIGVRIRQQLLNNKNARITLITLALIVIIAMLTTYLMTGTTNTTNESALSNETLKPNEQQINLRQHALTMPDNFTLYVSPYNGLIINWQADSTTKQSIWNIRQAQGDISCQHITFNNDNKIRSNLVTIENSENYFAEFSPLDTKDLIKNLAARGSFTLCGYSFSLKGSQAVLGKHSYYGELLTN
ncbi:hypothetical protein tinsulaeT_02580 [Thalassotalea insulae]|uniref:DUF805 domain-containing protein n=1 Tax=Thalassotalea insulae TaxID=2056778 RepID=A0ABQ6GLP0_9GAMM|nr:hypothetical protein [Thalassotalea insulae]GLX76918.1 hypothetical protein tinsulaeT_02580 [Thalassotalea insulae]